MFDSPTRAPLWIHYDNITACYFTSIWLYQSYTGCVFYSPCYNVCSANYFHSKFFASRFCNLRNRSVLLQFSKHTCILYNGGIFHKTISEAACISVAKKHKPKINIVWPTTVIKVVNNICEVFNWTKKTAQLLSN